MTTNEGQPEATQQEEKPWPTRAAELLAGGAGSTLVSMLVKGLQDVPSIVGDAADELSARFSTKGSAPGRKLTFVITAFEEDAADLEDDLDEVDEETEAVAFARGPGRKH